MTERAGCVSGHRGYGSRKFGGVTYKVYNIYVAKQTSGFSREEQDGFNSENTALMECDRLRLRNEGYKTRVLHEDGGQIHILYYIRRGGEQP
jgi:hypothetical protein